MPVQSLPSSAEAYTREQRAEIAAAVRAVKRQWQRMGEDFDSTFSLIAPSLLAITDTAQLRVAAGAVEYVPAVLEETDQTRYLNNRVGDPRPSAFVGVDGSGRPVEGLLGYSTVVAKANVAEGRTTAQALAAAGSWLSTAVGTMLSDTGRAAEYVGMANHRVGGYVRMLVPPSCSRCAILAGKWSGESVAFQRHPGCDCRHIPASESVAGDMLVDPMSYFESLPADEQDRVFGAGGAEAIREGADINQVVNADRGMRKAQIGGRDVLITTEGTTRRGWAYDALVTRGGTTTSVEGSAIRHTRDGAQLRNVRTTRARRPRMMPETLREVATDRDDFIRLLRANGYIL